MVLWSFGIILAVVAAAVGGGVMLLQTDWGHAQVLGFLSRQVEGILGTRGRLYVGHLEGGFDGHIALDSIVLYDDKGVVVASASRVDAEGSLAGFIRGDVRLQHVVVVHPYVFLARRDTVWNVVRLFRAPATVPASEAPASSPVAAPRSHLSITLDRAEILDGRLVMVQPDSLRSLPPQRREFSHLQLRLGPTRVLAPGQAVLQRLSVDIDRPPVSLRSAEGTVHWGGDAILLDLKRFRLPASTGSVRGTVSWAKKGPVRFDLRAHADTAVAADIQWMTSIIPRSAVAAADVRMHNDPANPRGMQYAVSRLDLRATRSHLTGEFVVTVRGPEVSVTALAIDTAPLDLDLVREILGDSVPPHKWRGALAGTIRGAGGPLRALRLDDVQMAYEDHRVPGAMSHVSLSGEIDTRDKPAELHALSVDAHDLDVRTIGAAVKAADALHGVLRGRLVLDGPVTNLQFHDLAMAHVDGDRARSYVRGEGRLATDTHGPWLDAMLSLDTVAIATLARDRSTLPLQGTVHGALELHAVADSMSIDALLHAGAGQAHFLGSTLLDSGRTSVHGRATLANLDPRGLIARKDIPVLRLDGAADVDVDVDAIDTDAHMDITLDTTRVIGSSHVSFARVRAGVDSNGFHVDTAEVHADSWELSARGRLARTGMTHDTLAFRAQFASLAPLRDILLDSLGATLADSVFGAVGATGVLVGSLDTLALTADFGLTGTRWNAVKAANVTGHVALVRLPTAGTGFLTVTASGVTAAGISLSRVQVRADMRDGTDARVAADLSSGDTITTRLVANLKRGGDTTHVALDSLAFVLGASRWSLQRPTRIEYSPRGLLIDSTTLRSATGATASLHAVLPEAGAADATIRIDGLGTKDLEFTGRISPALAAKGGAELLVTGTRDAPVITFTAHLDSTKVGKNSVPTLAATGRYGNRRATADLRGSAGPREVLKLTADVPIDLSLRSIPNRLLDGTVSFGVHADSASLAGLEAFSPQVENAGGLLWADDTIAGTWERKTWAGTVRVKDGAFDLPRLGTVSRRLGMRLRLQGDSVYVDSLHMADGDNTSDTVAVQGALVHTAGAWIADLQSWSKNFKLIDDPRLATVEATWNVHVKGPLKQPFVSGAVDIPTGSFVIGQLRNVRALKKVAGAADEALPVGMPIFDGLQVTLGSDVRLKSREANVQLSGALEVAGEVNNPYVSGVINASRGTYRVDLGVLKRTFRVDSGIVEVAGTKDVPAAINIWASYVVRRADQDDEINITAHLTGTTDDKRLELSSVDLGSGVAQSEIISYLIFGAPSFALNGQAQSTVRSATAVLVPSLGGVLEGFLGTLLPFFNSLQVTTVAGSGPQNITSAPLEGLLSSFALTAGRQVGTDSFLNLSAGVCRGRSTTGAQSAPAWFGVAAEYRPKGKLGAVISMDPGSSPCGRVGRFADIYQFGLDLFREWKY